MKKSFEILLERVIGRARQDGLNFIDINAGNLHRSVGGYPGANHRMPVCCAVLRSRMKSGDKVIDAPPKGYGATFTVRFQVG
jgi:5-methylcytosine-specific restriction protein A